MADYEILDPPNIDADGDPIRVTFHYKRDGIQKSCVFEYSAALENPPNPRVELENLLARGENPSGPIAYNAEGGSWRG